MQTVTTTNVQPLRTTSKKCRPRIFHQSKTPTWKIDQSENCRHEKVFALDQPESCVHEVSFSALVSVCSIVPTIVYINTTFSHHVAALWYCCSVHHCYDVRTPRPSSRIQLLDKKGPWFCSNLYPNTPCTPALIILSGTTVVRRSAYRNTVVLHRMG